MKNCWETYLSLLSDFSRSLFVTQDSFQIGGTLRRSMRASVFLQVLLQRKHFADHSKVIEEEEHAYK